MAKVKLRNGESQQQLLRRFRKVVTSSGIMGEVRKRRWFVSRTEERRLARKKTIRRLQKKSDNKARR